MLLLYFALTQGGGGVYHTGRGREREREGGRGETVNGSVLCTDERKSNLKCLKWKKKKRKGVCV